MDEVVMNGDLISRKALLNKMFPYGMPDNGNYGINARAVRDAVVGAKVVDAVEVVRCYKCKHSRTYKCKVDPMYNSLMCYKDDVTVRFVEDDFYCAYGERKTENE